MVQLREAGPKAGVQTSYQPSNTKAELLVIVELQGSRGRKREHWF